MSPGVAVAQALLGQTDQQPETELVVMVAPEQTPTLLGLRRHQLVLVGFTLAAAAVRLAMVLALQTRPALVALEEGAQVALR